MNGLTIVQDLGFVSAMHQHSGASKADDTQNSRGYVAYPLDSANCLFTLEVFDSVQGQIKHTQALPLKEDFRQFARPNNKPGLQTT
jgi:hypothetical protein